MTYNPTRNRASIEKGVFVRLIRITALITLGYTMACGLFIWDNKEAQ